MGRFDANVSGTETYYWQLSFSPLFRMWVPYALIEKEEAVNGGPTYNVPLTYSVNGYANGSLVNPLAAPASVGAMSATYYGQSPSGCPGTCFMQTTFTAPRLFGDRGYYEIKSNGFVVLSGFITRSSRPPFVSVGGGDLAACSDDDGINGGNS